MGRTQNIMRLQRKRGVEHVSPFKQNRELEIDTDSASLENERRSQMNSQERQTEEAIGDAKDHIVFEGKLG